MTFHLVCRDCTDLEDLYDDGGEAFDDARDHVDEHPDHTATFGEVV